MSLSVWMHALILLIGVFLASVSQVMLKKAAKNNYTSVIREYLNPYVLFAYVIFVCTTLLSVIAYKGIPLSLGPILESTGYIYVTFFGIRIFGEKITKKKLLSLGLLLLGIFVYAFLG